MEFKIVLKETCNSCSAIWKYQDTCCPECGSEDIEDFHLMECNCPECERGERIKTEIFNEKGCGTCAFWERKSATSSRTGYVIPNALCECKVQFEIPGDLPFSVQRVVTFYNDGANCKMYQKVNPDFKIEVMRG